MAGRGYYFGLGYPSWEWNERMSGWAWKIKKKNKEREREKKTKVFILTWLYMWYTGWVGLTKFQKSQPTT